jgi:hypothetical protein
MPYRGSRKDPFPGRRSGPVISQICCGPLLTHRVSYVISGLKFERLADFSR